MNSESRIARWDNIKGILILLVVLSHFFMATEFESTKMMVNLLFCFHMPAFALVSGVFSDEKSASLKKQAPFIFAFVLLNIGFAFYHFIKGAGVFGLEPMYVSWYMLALVVWRIARKYIEPTKKNIIISFAIGMVAGLIPVIDNTFALSRIICVFPFFLIGGLIPRDKDFGEIKNSKLCGIMLTVMGLFVYFFAGKFLYISVNEEIYLPYYNVKSIVARFVIYLVAAMISAGIVLSAPQSNKKLLTKIGRNSLSIYLIHRFVVFAFGDLLFPHIASEGVAIAAGLVLTIATSIVLASDKLADFIKRVLGVNVLKPVTTNLEKGVRTATFTLAAGYILMAIVSFGVPLYLDYIAEPPMPPTYFFYMPERLSEQEVEDINNSFTILFAGDMILLEDQVRDAYDGTDYDFGEMFEYTKSYITDADLAIAVLEGPLGGAELGYSSSNFNDDKPLYLNYPDEFAQDIYDAGFDVVTLANNHLLDVGGDAVTRTLDTLDQIGLIHTGAYRNSEERANPVQIVEQDGIRIAILSYTYGMNNYVTEDLMTGDLAYTSSFIVDPSSELFEETKANVIADFEQAKLLNPDLIVVLPHMGEQFATVPNEYQETWRNIFIDNGADIILGDHTHSVQPATIENINGKNVFTVYSPGNYANSYREFDGDASAMVEVYIDRDTLEVTGGSIIPLWTESQIDGNYRAIPIYDITINEELQSELTTDDLNRASEAYELITEVMLGRAVPLYASEPHMYFDADGYRRKPIEPLEILDEYKNDFYDALTTHEDVCFIGDSITCGSNNIGYPWFEPIESLISGRVDNISFPGATTVTIQDDMPSPLPDSDLYVFSIGTNDVRYRIDIGAMTSEEYINNLETMVFNFKAVNPDADFAFVAPWISCPDDNVKRIPYEESLELNAEYSRALEEYCEANNYLYINPNAYISEYLTTYSQYDYLVDYIHPNPRVGIYMYCEAVLSY